MCAMTADACRMAQSECRRQLLDALRVESERQKEDIREIRESVHDITRKFDAMNNMVIELSTIMKLHQTSGDPESGIKVKTRRQDTASGWWMENWKIIVALFFPLQLLLLLMAAALGQHFHGVLDTFADQAPKITPK